MVEKEGGKERGVGEEGRKEGRERGREMTTHNLHPHFISERLTEPAPYIASTWQDLRFLALRIYTCPTSAYLKGLSTLPDKANSCSKMETANNFLDG